jgi:hypothetical protein
MPIELGTDRAWVGAQASLKFFTVNFLKLQWNTHYEEWRQVVDASDRVLVQAPRGSRKSYFFSLAYPLWRIIRGKTDILMVSDSEEQARKNLRTIRDTIESSPALSPLLPSTKELWGTDQAQFRNASIINIMGFGTSKRGEHPDVIINDDIESERNKMSREDKNRMFFAVIVGMAIANRTKILTIGTPLDFGDLLDQIEKKVDDKGNPIYSQWKRPALKGGVTQYPDLWSEKDLEFKRFEMGSLEFSREMLLDRIDPSTQPFKREYETTYKEVPPRARLARVVTVCDPAYSETDGDFTAIVTVGFTHGNHAYVLEAKAIRRENPGDVVDELFKTIAIHTPDAVGIERRKGEAVSFSFEERRTRENRWDFKYVELSHHGSGKDDTSRIGGLVPRWEARTIHIHPEMKQLLNQIYCFRLKDGSKDHDDLVDALAYCFSPDMAHPNGGRRHAQSQNEMEGRPLFRVGQKHDAPRLKSGAETLWSRLDRRVYDKAAA